MPEKYTGSTFGAEQNQMESKSSYSMGLLNEYIRDQSVLLFKQIKLLPWISDDDLEGIVNSLSTEINSVANKKRNDPLYGN
jgi:hypothetical protein